MPISNDIKVTPSDTSGGGPSAVVPEGVYNAEITDITFVPGEQNQYTGKPQLKFRFKLLDKEYEGLELRAWVSMSLNPGWDKGSPSNLYLIAKAVMGEEPNPDQDFLPVWLMGGKLRVLVEERTSAKGTTYSRVTKYLAPEGVQKAPKNKTDEEMAEAMAEEPPVPEDKEKEVPF